MSEASEKPLSLTRYPISISVCSPFIKYLRSDARNPASDIYYLISGHQVICVNAHAAECDAFSFKEVIQPQVPLRLPCYDFTPVINHTVVSALLTVKQPTSGAANSHGVTGGVYKARERIHRDMLIRDY